MLTSKFSVFATNHILYNTSKFPSCTQHLNPFNKTLRCNRSNKSDSNIVKHRKNPYDKCKQNAEDLLRYTKKDCIQPRCEKKKPLDKCGTITIVSEYEEARKQINDLIGGITKFFDTEKEAIIESLKKEARVDKDDTCRWLQNVSDSVDQKLQQLVQLDSCLGTEVRTTVLRFKDHARNTFIALHCELAPSIKQVELILEKIQTEISQCIQKAAILTLVCRCSGSPSIFKKCLLDNAAEAKNILNHTRQKAETKLKEVKKLRDYMLKCHKEAIDEETSNHSSEMQALSKYLDDCLADLKKQIK